MHRNASKTRFICRRARRPSSASPATTGTPRELPADLLLEASRRLRILSLCFAGAFFMANFFPAILSGEVGELFSHFSNFGPGAISIAVSLAIFWLAGSPRVAPKRLMDSGLIFSVFGSYGIAMAQYWWFFSRPDLAMQNLEAMGLSWVAPWMVIVPIFIPNLPWKTLLASLGSATAAPVVISLSLKLSASTLVIGPMPFFLNVILPYLIIVGMTLASGHIFRRLGTEVSRARELGSYELIEKLGEGGMGEVWRAKHRMLVRPAAIKLVRPEVLGGEDGEASRVALKRFEREAQATAAMRSPHTIGLYDFGIADDGTFYYVMELLHGFDLDSLVSRFGPMPPERTLHLLTQICHSLGEAHDNGLIHRDIKPANVYICRYGRAVDHVKVLDFGLVKSQREIEGEDMKLTAAHVTGGTPAFMSPEQALGDRLVDARTDIYAVGCVGYWLLTGQMVFSGGTALQTIMHHVNTVPEAPSSCTELPIPATLDRLILQCLEKEPDARPQDADQLTAMLAGCDPDECWTEERARHWWETHAPPRAEGTEPAGPTTSSERI